MQIEIAGTKYKIILTDREKLTINDRHSPIQVYCPAHLPLDRLKLLLQKQQQTTLAPVETSYLAQPLQLFDQSYLVRILHNQAHNEVLKTKTGIRLSLKPQAQAEKILQAWQKKYLFSQLMDQIGYWEEKLDILVGEIGLRHLKKNYYRINKSRNAINFDYKIVNLSFRTVQFLSLQAIVQLCELNPTLLQAYFPEEMDLGN